MATTCTVQAGATVAVGDAVCVVGFDDATYPTRPVIVARASASNLATSKTVFGISRENKTNTQAIAINVAGDVSENAITSLGAGDSRIIATDINQAAAVDQCRLKRVDRPDGSEYVVGTCDESGNVALQPRGSQDTSSLHVFNVRAYGARGDSPGDGSGTDDAAAIQAAIAAAGGYANVGGADASVGVVYFPPGLYRCSSKITIDTAVQLRGPHGNGVYALAVLFFDDNLAEDALVEIQHNGGLGAYTSIFDLGIMQLRSNVRNELLTTVGLAVHAQGVHLHDVVVQDIAGDGIEIAGNAGEGTFANGWSLTGKVRVATNDRYGIHVHGGDANGGGMTGQLELMGNKSWGIVESSQHGNGWTGAISTEGNGFRESLAEGQWQQGGAAVDAAHVWSASKVVGTAGWLMLPSVGNGSGFFYRARDIGAAPHETHATTEPAWPTTIGATVQDGDILWECWAEIGGPIKSDSLTGSSTWGWVYQEGDQSFCRLDARDVVAGGITDTAWDPTTSSVLFGPLACKLVPFEVQSARLDDPGTITRPLRMRMGEQGSPLAGFAKFAGNSADITGSFEGGVANLRDYWDERFHRWSRQVYREVGVSQAPSYYDFFSFTEAEGRSGPQPGAVCWPSLWLGGVVGAEKRMTAVAAKATAPYAPDFTDVAGSTKGGVRKNDLVLNTAAEDRPSVPLAWRAKDVGGIASHNTWAASYPYDAGILLRPGTAGDPLYLARNSGTTGATEPAFADVRGTSYVDGTVVWDWWGTYGDDTVWEPVIAELPTTPSIDVSAGGTITLTEDEAAHARIKLVGALTSDVTVLVPPGPAEGWSRDFWNATSGAFTVSVGATMTGAAVAIAQGAVSRLFANTVDVLSITGNSGNTASSMQEATFTSSGTWTAPAGVTNVLLVGYGGGGGGGGGLNAQSADSHTAGGGGGGAAVLATRAVTVVPGEDYAITIGAGGSGGAVGSNGSNGGATTFALASPSTVLAELAGGAGGLAGKVSAQGPNGFVWGLGGASVAPASVPPASMDVQSLPDLYRDALPSRGGNGVTGNNASYRQESLAPEPPGRRGGDARRDERGQLPGRRLRRGRRGRPRRRGWCGRQWWHPQQRGLVDGSDGRRLGRGEQWRRWRRRRLERKRDRRW